MKKLKIGLVQERWHADGELHLARLQEGVARAVEGGAELVCLQELTLAPYFPTQPGVAGAEHAEGIPHGPTCQFARRLARQYGVYLTASLFEAAGPGYNTAVCFSPSGELVGLTRKQHIPGGAGYHEDEHFQPGDSDYPVHQVAGVRTALPTCYDQWFPELARIYALKQAELIIYPTAIGSEPSAPGFDSQPLWQKVIVANGIMNNVFMAAVNRVGEEGGVVFYGSSFISDPLGNILAQAPRDEPAVLVAELDFGLRDQWGGLFPFLKQRQPKTYTRLTAEDA